MCCYTKQSQLTDFNQIQLLALKKGSHKAFKAIYDLYYYQLHKYALTFVKDVEFAEEMVHEAFLMIWDKREMLNIEFNIKAYLYKSIHNQALNYLRHNKIVQKYFSETINSDRNTNTSFLPEPFMKKAISGAIDNLPVRLKQIFILSRIEGLKHKEISAKLGISEKTVEVHIRNARITLRKKLKSYYKELDN